MDHSHSGDPELTSEAGPWRPPDVAAVSNILGAQSCRGTQSFKKETKGGPCGEHLEGLGSHHIPTSSEALFCFTFKHFGVAYASPVAHHLNVSLIRGGNAGGRHPRCPSCPQVRCTPVPIL